MAEAIINFQFSGSGAANVDRTVVATVQGAREVPGPGGSELGTYSTALAFGPGVSCHTQVQPGMFNAERFAVRVLFRATAPVTTRNNLVESNAVPFALLLEPGSEAQHFNVTAAVENSVVRWTTAGSLNRVQLVVGRWYVASLVYDRDTMVLMIDGRVAAVSAFRRGALQPGAGDALFVGTWIDGARWPLNGEVAALQVWRDIPPELAARADAERGGAEWHLTLKENEVRTWHNLGPKAGDFFYDTTLRAWIQSYALGVISYVDGDPSAYLTHGAILGLWRSDAGLRAALGPAASDEVPGRQDGSRKSAFRNGAIYWSPATGAQPVLGRMYLDFELLGEGNSPIGLPVAPSEAAPGGRCQRFQRGRMYLRDGASNAFEVHGDILGKFEATGGVAKWGFPVSHESDVMAGGRSIGRVSQFEGCTIYWSPATGAAVTYGDIRQAYHANGGPAGALGFLTSDEGDIPGAPAPARYNTCERGSILWFGGETVVCRPFRFHLGHLDTKEEDRDIFDADGQNDLYCRICVGVNGNRVFDRKIPEGPTCFPSANIRDLNYTVPYAITPNNPHLKVDLEVQVWESDAGTPLAGGDDHLGTIRRSLTMANAWGLRESANGLFSAGAESGPWMNRLDYSLKPVVGSATPLDFWGVQNRGTAALEWGEYAAAFADVDPESEFDLGILDDGLKALFYETVVKGVASGGNCFGMALESIYAWKGLSRLGRPLGRFTDWRAVENDFNVKHAYQMGADALWWFVGQFLSGRTHDPCAVFEATRDAYARGLNPVLCIAQNYDFTGAPHCILPVGWDTSSNPWRMEIFDPNTCNTRQCLTVDPDANTFRYSAGGWTWTGAEWSGGRMHYMPWSVVNHRQRTPVWDAIMLALGGLVVLFGESTEVETLTDAQGRRIDGASATRRDQLRGKLVRVPGVSGGPVRGALYMGRTTPAPIQPPGGYVPTVAQGKAAPAPTGKFRQVLSPKLRIPVKKPVVSDAMLDSLVGPRLLDVVRESGLGAARGPEAGELETVRAALRGRASAPLAAYYKRALSGVDIRGEVATGEAVAVGFDRQAARDNEVSIQSDRARRYDVTVYNKLAGGSDFIRMKIQGISAEPGRAVKLNVQPGLAAVDVLGGAAQLAIRVEGKVDGRAVIGDFSTTLEGGARISLPDRMDPAALEVGAIDNLMGLARAVRTLNRR